MSFFTFWIFANVRSVSTKVKQKDRETDNAMAIGEIGDLP